MTQRGLAVVRAAGALLLTAALVGGVPLLLLALVGNPFPSSLPSIDEVRILLTQNGEGFSNFVIGVLAVLIWAIWAQLLLALFAEVIAAARQAETRRLPTAPGIQALAARLVASIVLATTLATGPLIVPAVGALNLGDLGTGEVATKVVVDVRELDTTAAPQSSISSLDQKTDLIAAKTSLAVDSSATFVAAEDTELWDLAEVAYGDGVSWKLIAEANAGQQDANGAILSVDTAVIASGTELVLPGVVDIDGLAGLGTVSQVGDHVVEAGESLWTISESEIERRMQRSPTTAEVAEYWSEVVENNQHVPSGDVDLLFPGDRVVLPGAADEVLADEVTANDPVVEETIVVEPGVASTDEVERVESDIFETIVVEPGVLEPVVLKPVTAEVAPSSEDDNRSHWPAGVGLAGFGGAMLAAGVLGAVRRRRDIQRRTRPTGAMARAHSTETAAFEAALIHASHQVVESRQGAGWRMLPVEAVAAARSVGPLEIHAEASGRLRAVVVDPEPESTESRRLELDATLERADVEALFHRSLPGEINDQLDAGLAAAPTTLLIGTEAETGDAAFVDLASVGSVALAGDESGVRRFARTAMIDLAVSDRADDLYVIGIDIGEEVQDLERVRLVASFPAALESARRCGHAASDSSTPLIVVSAVAPPANDCVAKLRALGAYVVAPGVTSGAQILIEGNRATIKPAGTVVELAALDDHQYRSLAELVDTTSAQAFEQVDESVPLGEQIGVVAADDCFAAAGPIDVKVLGPVEVTGAQPFSSLKAVDVITYLAFHRNGVDADQIKTWVWPTYSPPTDKAFANVMSRARTGLGADGAGSPYLSRAGADKTYRLSAEVTTDFDRFRAIVEMAEAADTIPQTVARLRQALELVRGVPFTGGSASSFAWADNRVRAQLEYAIDEAVHRCADLAIEIGDLASARWAALKGLELVPGCEQCYRRRFLVAGAGNNRTELRRAMADLERTAAAELGEPEAVDSISDELLDLFQELDRALVAGSN